MSTIGKFMDLSSVRLGCKYTVCTEGKDFVVKGGDVKFQLSNDGCMQYSSGLRGVKQFYVNVSPSEVPQTIFRIRFGRPSSFLINVDCFSKGVQNKYCRDLHDIVYSTEIKDDVVNYSSKHISYYLDGQFLIYQITPEECTQKCVVSIEITCFQEDTDAVTITK